MRVLSSQRHLDDDKIAEKLDLIKDENIIYLPVIYAGEYDGESIYILIDGHHTRAAALELGIEIDYNIQDRREAGYNNEWDLDEVLENLWMDSEWYDVETGIDYF